MFFLRLSRLPSSVCRTCCATPNTPKTSRTSNVSTPFWDRRSVKRTKPNVNEKKKRPKRSCRSPKTYSATNFLASRNEKDENTATLSRGQFFAESFQTVETSQAEFWWSMCPSLPTPLRKSKWKKLFFNDYHYSGQMRGVNFTNPK